MPKNKVKKYGDKFCPLLNAHKKGLSGRLSPEKTVRGQIKKVINAQRIGILYSFVPICPLYRLLLRG